MKLQFSRLDILFALSLLVPLSASAHHGRGEFFEQPSGEIEGVVVDVRWRNPHVTITVQGAAEDGSEELWVLEGSDAGTLARRGVADGHVRVGDRIRAAGSISNRRERWLATSNILLPSGTELVFGRSGNPRWSANHIGGEPLPAEGTITEEASAGGIFRLWMSNTGTPYVVEEEPPLTPAARASWQAYDGLRHDPVLDCEIPGMPRVMTVVGARPIQFERQGEDILLRSENYNLTRLIHMAADEDPGDVPTSPLGYSRGRWEGETLVVTTSRISWPYFDLPPLIGIPQSEEVEIEERFTLTEGRLVYDFRAYDPVNFTAPIEKTGYKAWSWHPGLTLATDACEDYVEVD